MSDSPLESKRTRSAGGVVLNPQRQVLIVNQKGNSWSLPKGHIDPGEDAVTAAQREIWEEAGVSELHLVKAFPPYERYKLALDGGDEISELKQIEMFLFTTEQTALKPIDPENPEARWVDKSEVPALLTHPKDRAFFLSILDQLTEVDQPIQ